MYKAIKEQSEILRFLLEFLLLNHMAKAIKKNLVKNYGIRFVSLSRQLSIAVGQNFVGQMPRPSIFFDQDAKNNP